MIAFVDFESVWCTLIGKDKGGKTRRNETAEGKGRNRRTDMIGPKCSGTLFALGVWGAIFMAVLGGLFYNESVGLFEDLPEVENEISKTWDEVKTDVRQLYKQNAYNAWVAAAVNAGLALVAAARMFCLARR